MAFFFRDKKIMRSAFLVCFLLSCYLGEVIEMRNGGEKIHHQSKQINENSKSRESKERWSEGGDN